jgi:TetR/AcrR family transcriptional repressor of mexJK operon
MQHLLEQANSRGQLQVDNPQHAAEHFFCLIKGGCHFRLLMGVAQPLGAQEAEEHVQEVVKLFVRAYRP